MITDELKTLWAPWRIEYILRERNDECVFCVKAQAPLSQDEENLVLARGTHTFVLMNTYPYNPGHLLVVPYAHVEDVSDLPAEARHELMDLLVVWKERLQECMRAHGMNIGINLGQYAGAGIASHVHAHIVPRWIGDTNFMTTVGDTRVMSQSLHEIYALLTKDEKDA